MMNPSDRLEIDNADRASLGRLCVLPVADHDNAPPGTMIIDALADIMHYSHSEGLDFRYLSSMATEHFRAEIQCGCSLCPQ